MVWGFQSVRLNTFVCKYYLNKTFNKTSNCWLASSIKNFTLSKRLCVLLFFLFRFWGCFWVSVHGVLFYFFPFLFGCFSFSFLRVFFVLFSFIFINICFPIICILCYITNCFLVCSKKFDFFTFGFSNSTCKKTYTTY